MTQANLNSVTVAGLRNFVRLAVKHGYPLFVHGTFGIGKTEIVSQELRKLGYTPVDWFRASSMSPDTVAGIPYMVEGELRRAVPEIVAACRRVAERGERPALVLDELNIASPSMLGAMLQLLREKHLGGEHLPEGTPVLAMGNLDTDASIVHRLPLPAANRMMHIAFEGPTVDEWNLWAAANDVHPAIMATVKQQPELLNERRSVAGAEATSRYMWATPRTWAMLSDMLKEVKENDDWLTVAAAVVGEPAAVALQTTMAGWWNIVPFELVVEKPDGAPLPDDERVGAAYMQAVTLYQGMRKHVDSDRFDQMLTAVMSYLTRLGKSWKTAFVSMLFDADEKLAGRALMSGVLADEDLDMKKFFAAR